MLTLGTDFWSVAGDFTIALRFSNIDALDARGQVLRRNEFFTCMEMLAVLREGPKNRTRLAQACNINYARLDEFLPRLMAMDLVKEGMMENQSLLTLTPEGSKYYSDWEAVWNRFQSVAEK